MNLGAAGTKLTQGGNAFIQQATGIRVRNLVDIKSAISQLWPPVIAVPVYGDSTGDYWSNRSNPNGAIDVPQPGEKFYGYHAIMLTSYDDATSTVGFVNSWGAWWGKNG